MKGIISHGDGTFSGAKMTSLLGNIQAVGVLLVSVAKPELITPNVLVLVAMILLFSYLTRDSARKAAPGKDKPPTAVKKRSA